VRRVPLRRGGQAWLLIDRATLAEARRQVRGSTLWFQRLQAWYLLTVGRVSAPTVAAVAARAGLDPNRLEATLAASNAAACDPAAADPTGKPAAAWLPTPRHPEMRKPPPGGPGGGFRRIRTSAGPRYLGWGTMRM
jgi:3-oxo-5alpha-steroid 4-dehydrogenase